MARRWWKATATRPPNSRSGSRTRSPRASPSSVARAPPVRMRTSNPIGDPSSRPPNRQGQGLRPPSNGSSPPSSSRSTRTWCHNRQTATSEESRFRMLDRRTLEQARETSGRVHKGYRRGPVGPIGRLRGTDRDTWGPRHQSAIRRYIRGTCGARDRNGLLDPP